VPVSQPRRARAAVLLSSLLVLLAGVLVGPGAGEAAASDAVVDVGADGDERYAPAEVTVAPGETVTFVWVDDDHSVTHQADVPEFDSHPVCTEGPLTGTGYQCGDEGEELEVELDEPGAYDFACRLHDDMTGTITVAEESEPDEDTDADESGSSDGSSEPSDGSGSSDEPSESSAGAPEADEDAGSSASSSGGQEGAGGDAGAPPEDGDDEEDPQQQAAMDSLAEFSPERSSPQGIGGSPVPDEDLRQDGLEEPEVEEPDAAEGWPGFQVGVRDLGDPESDPEADPETDLEPFPEAEDSTDADEVALPAQDGGDRTVPIAIATVGVLGVGAAALRQVLVGF
jgi:plastocyanin